MVFLHRFGYHPALLGHGGSVMSRGQGMALVLLCGAVPAWAGEPAAKPAAAEVVVQFNDGSTIHKATIQGTIDLVTRYGKLSVPVSDVRRMEFGLLLSPQT